MVWVAFLAASAAGVLTATRTSTFKVAKALGLTVPPMLLTLADELIE
jgi:hypothetical protein